MSTIKDVAKAAGVSVATVSRVVNKSPKASQSAIEAVTAAMQQLGYRPNAAARALVSQKSNTIGVLVADVSDPFFGALIKAVDEVARNNDKQILIGNGYHSADDERRALDLLINSRCEAIVVHAKGLSDEALMAYAQEVPGLVVINRLIPQLAHRCIALDNHKGAYLATQHLLTQGHRHIGCIASNHDIEDTTQRIQGYESALLAHGIGLDANYLAYGEPNSDGGESAMTQLLNRSLPITAIVAYNDYMAAGAMETLAQNTYAVPSGISVVGFDDGLIARFVKPSLTTVCYPIESMAHQAAQLALALASGLTLDNTTTVFSPTLVQRHSVARRE